MFGLIDHIPSFDAPNRHRLCLLNTAGKIWDGEYVLCRRSRPRGLDCGLQTQKIYKEHPCQQ